MKRCFRVVLTGGPGGGKTTAADLYRREIGDQVIIVPEAATLLYSGGFPRTKDLAAQKLTQKAIYHLQTSLEDVQAAQYCSRLLLCDRGTLDGLAYWPDSNESFFQQMNSNLQTELDRYDAVIFFETAAVGGMSIEGGNPTRTESLQEAINIDQKLRQIWQQHPNFVLVEHNKSFLKKVSSGLSVLSRIVQSLHNKAKG